MDVIRTARNLLRTLGELLDIAFFTSQPEEGSVRTETSRLWLVLYVYSSFLY